MIRLSLFVSPSQRRIRRHIRKLENVRGGEALDTAMTYDRILSLAAETDSNN